MKRLLALGTSMAAIAVPGTAVLAAPIPIATWTYSSAGATTWSTPTGGGQFIVIAAGAQGGQGDASGYGQVGGQGAMVEGTFVFLGGTTLNISVGAMGGSGGGGGGGGGASFVSSAGTPLLVAGGGGGVGAMAPFAGSPGTVPAGTGFSYGTFGSGNTGVRGGYENTGYYAAGSAGPSSTYTGPGGPHAAPGYGTGGGGWSDAAGNNSYGTGGGALFSGGAGGMVLGCSNLSLGFGGFGGGGSGECYGGGGGGGFIGGGGGVIGGGGGSFISASASSPYGIAGAQSGNGQIIIEELVSYSGSGSAAPEPASIAMLAAGLGGLGLMRRRRGLLRVA